MKFEFKTGDKFDVLFELVQLLKTVIKSNKISEIENWDEIIEFLDIINQDYELALSQLKDNYIEH